MRRIEEEYVERNRRLVELWIKDYAEDSIYAKRLACRSSWYHHGLERHYLDHVRLPVGEAYYDLFFPDHCPGSTVFHAVLTVYRSSDFGFFDYVPGIAVACSHFEYGDLTGELARLHTLAEIVAEEAFDTETDMIAEIVDPVSEKLLLIVEPTFYKPWTTTTIGKALRLYSDLVRHQLLSAENLPRRLAWFISRL